MYELPKSYSEIIHEDKIEERNCFFCKIHVKNAVRIVLRQDKKVFIYEKSMDDIENEIEFIHESDAVNNDIKEVIASNDKIIEVK